MTYDDYVMQIATALRDGHDSKDRPSIDAAFRGADQTLENSNFNDSDRRKFWQDVRNVFGKLPIRMERQANSSLVALMQAIQQGLASRGG